MGRRSRTHEHADRVIVAFDTGELQEAVKLAKQLRGLIRYAKIGSTLFTASGPLAVQRFKALGFEVFLDLKFHDIPSTVEKSCRAAAQLGVSLLTVHASGEPRMLEAAARGVRQGAAQRGFRRPRVLGVTVLTSIESAQDARLARRVVELAAAAKRSGLDGVVSSVWEAQAIRRRVGGSFLIVCPGIRPMGAAVLDQARVASPREALARGADFLVVGRPITQAPDPRTAVQQLLAEIA